MRQDSCDYIAVENIIPACDRDKSKISQLKYLIDHCYKMTNPDIILLCETWLTPNSSPITIPGYKFFCRDRIGKKGGGIGILVSELLQSSE